MDHWNARQSLATNSLFFFTTYTKYTTSRTEFLLVLILKHQITGMIVRPAVQKFITRFQHPAVLVDRLPCINRWYPGLKPWRDFYFILFQDTEIGSFFSKGFLTTRPRIQPPRVFIKTYLFQPKRDTYTKKRVSTPENRIQYSVWQSGHFRKTPQNTRILSEHKTGGKKQKGAILAFSNKGSMPRKKLLKAKWEPYKKDAIRIAFWCIRKHYNLFKFWLF